MSTNRSRFGQNLTLQFVIGVMLGVFSSSLPRPVGDCLDTLGMILFSSFWFGIVYGFFRLFGANGGIIEWYYQNFPIGFLSQPYQTSTNGNSAQGQEVKEQKTTNGLSDIEWERFLSVKYVRYIALLLIVSAAFSYLFKIEWDLLEKIAVSVMTSLVALVAAELTRRKNHPTVASICYLIGFALLQFSLTLIFYLFHRDEPNLLYANPEFWLFVKAGVSIAFLLLLPRYQQDFSAFVYFLIAYSTPLTVLSVGPVVSTSVGLAYLCLMTVAALTYAVRKAEYEIVLLNGVAVNLYTLFFLYGPKVMARSFSLDNALVDSGLAKSTFVMAIVFFCLQLFAGVRINLKGKFHNHPMTAFEPVLTHFFSIVCLLSVQIALPVARDYMGVTWLGISLLSFGACSYVESKGLKNRYSNTLLHLALLFSAIGLFVQAKGPWTAIVFLLYSCVVLYASLFYASRGTKIYAFIVLTVSVFKLYLECSELFNSISGTTAVLFVGILLLILSYKIESVKKLLPEKPPEKPTQA